MKKKVLALFLAVACALSCAACAGKAGNGADSSAPNETEAADGKTTPDTTPEETVPEETIPAEEDGGGYEYPSEDAGPMLWESPLGYSMTYDPTVFTLDDTGEADIFTYNTAEKLDAPVYLSVQSYPDMDAQTLAEGLALQSGVDGVEPFDVNFGAEGIAGKCVYIEREVDGLKQIQIFDALPAGEGSLLVEMGTYAGVPQSVDWKMEEVTGSFTLTAE